MTNEGSLFWYEQLALVDSQAAGTTRDITSQSQGLQEANESVQRAQVRVLPSDGPECRR